MTEMCFLKEGIQGVCFTQASRWQQGGNCPSREVPLLPHHRCHFPSHGLVNALPRLYKPNPGVLLCSISCAPVLDRQLQLVSVSPTDAQTAPRSSLGELGTPLAPHHPQQQHCVPHHLHGDQTHQVNDTLIPAPISARRFSGPSCRYITNSPCLYFAGRV